MPHERLTFRQRDVKAAIKAVEAAGKSVERVFIRPGEVEVIIASAADEEGSTTTAADKRILERIKNAVPPKKVRR